MKFLTFIFLIFILSSCNEKVVLLPTTTNSDITEVLDISPVYMFYDETTKSIEFNRKNMISTTNWLVNIDKRLSLSQVLPHLQYLQEKRRGDGMHKNENARHYFTCNNTDIKNLSFIEFTEINFNNENIETYIEAKTTAHSKIIIQINFTSNQKVSIKNKTNEITINTDIALWMDMIKKETKDLNKNYVLIFKFDPTLTFQEYIKIKTQQLKLKTNNVTIANNEFIHN